MATTIIRQAAVAGQFYPRSRQALLAEIESYFMPDAQARPALVRRIEQDALRAFTSRGVHEAAGARLAVGFASAYATTMTPTPPAPTPRRAAPMSAATRTRLVMPAKPTFTNATPAAANARAVRSRASSSVARKRQFRLVPDRRSLDARSRTEAST